MTTIVLKVPDVLSMSLGSLSGASCDLLCSEAAKEGHSEKDCNDFLQQQRQVLLLEVNLS